MHELTKLIKDDMKPALGVTEPGAIAFAVSTAVKWLADEVSSSENTDETDIHSVIAPEDIESVSLKLNSGMYKNAFTCGIPNSTHVGNLYSAALGAIAGDPSKGLECLAAVTDDDNRVAEKMVGDGKIEAEMSEISSRIHICAAVSACGHTAEVTIWDSHTNITEIKLDGEAFFRQEGFTVPEISGNGESAGSDEGLTDMDTYDSSDALIHKYTLAQIYDYVKTAPADEISFIMDAHKMNYDLAMLGIKDPKTTYARSLLKMNGGHVISDSVHDTAALLCGAAIEARVLGLDLPAMSITGSGSHGIIATMGLYAAALIRGISNEQLTRATALSYLICMYIKEYSGKLSAFCGCAIAAGTGMACGLAYLDGGDVRVLGRCINNMASGITGMICDGGNHGCTVKGITAVDAAFRAEKFAMAGVSIGSEHGINGRTPEETMHNMGLIASPGMTATEGTIVEIMRNK